MAIETVKREELTDAELDFAVGGTALTFQGAGFVRMVGNQTPNTVKRELYEGFTFFDAV